MDKTELLIEKIKSYGRLAVAFSGGTDSTLLAETARRVLGPENVLLLHAASIFIPEAEGRFAAAYAARSGLRLLTVEFAPLEFPEVRRNDELRCYHCKKLIFAKLQQVAAEHGFPVLADGANVDDTGDYRPGMQAAAELGVAHPLLTCGLGKADIRALARRFELANADTPASACLASRVPTGTPLAAEALRRIGAAETALAQLGFAGFRVRAFDTLAKLEFRPADLERALAERGLIVAAVKAAGFESAALDLEGYRTGAMNRKR